MKSVAALIVTAVASVILNLVEPVPAMSGDNTAD